MSASPRRDAGCDTAPRETDFAGDCGRPYFFANEPARPLSRLPATPASAPQPPVAPTAPTTRGIKVDSVPVVVEVSPALEAAAVAPRLNGRPIVPSDCRRVTMPSPPDASCTLGRDSTGVFAFVGASVFGSVPGSGLPVIRSISSG